MRNQKDGFQSLMASIANSPAEAVEGCDIVFMCVGNDKDVEEVVRGDKVEYCLLFQKTQLL